MPTRQAFRIGHHLRRSAGRSHRRRRRLDPSDLPDEPTSGGQERYQAPIESVDAAPEQCQ
jgi:hypothetical protein